MKSNLLKFMPTAVALVLLGTAAGAANKPAHHPAPAHHAGTKQTHHLVTVNMDLDFKPHTRSSYGKLLGYSPIEVRVHQNDQIQFVNVDDQQHTATGMSSPIRTAASSMQRMGYPQRAPARQVTSVRSKDRRQLFLRLRLSLGQRANRRHHRRALTRGALGCPRVELIQNR